MWPHLKSQDKVIVKKAAISDLRCGDIILYREAEKLVCHRLIKKVRQDREYLLYSRGDTATSYFTEPVTEEMFQGKVSAIIRNEKIISLEGLGSKISNRMIALSSPLFMRLVKLALAIKRWIIST